MTQSPAHTENLPEAPDGIRVAIPFAAIVLAMLPAVLDQTILATALPTIAGDLGSLSDVSWVVTAYVVAAAASMPLWGKLGLTRRIRDIIRLLRGGTGHHPAGSAADGPGRGRGRADDPGHGRGRRSRLAA